MALARIPLDTYIFIMIFSLPPRSKQRSGAHVNEIKHDHSPVVMVVLDPQIRLIIQGLAYLYPQNSFKTNVSGDCDHILFSSFASPCLDFTNPPYFYRPSGTDLVFYFVDDLEL